MAGLKVSIKDKITTKTFLQLLRVQIISTIISVMGNLIDGIITSRFLGSVNMSAYGVGYPVVIFMVAFAFVLSSGSQAVCGRYMGSGNVEEINKTINRVIFCGIIAALVFNVVLFAFAQPIAVLMGAKGEVIPACADYLRGFSFSALGVILSPVLNGYMQMDRDGKRSMVSSVVLLICCTSLDLLNVFVLKLGMLGMGLTTSVSYAVSILILFLHFTRKDRSLSLSLKLFSLKGTGKVIKTGLPAATYHLSNFIKTLSANLVVISVGGAAGIFSCTVLNSVNSVIMGFVNGTGLTTILLCSVIAGEGNRRSLHHTLKFIFRVGAVIGVVLGVLLFILADVCIADFYCTGDSSVYREQVVTMFRIYSVCIIFAITDSIFINYFQSMKKLALANMICILDNAAYFIIAMLALSGIMGLNGVWAAYIAAELITILTIIVISRIKTKHFPVSLHDLMLIPDDFGVDSEHRLNMTITSGNEITGISDAITDFGRKLGIDEKRYVAAGHCMEELAYLTISNAKARKKTYVDIYLTYTDGELKLRMRDNGTPIDVSILNPWSGSNDSERTFGSVENAATGNTEERTGQDTKQVYSGVGEKSLPNSRIDTISPEEAEQNLGMKIIYGMAKSVNYNVVLGLNVFSIEL